MLAVMPIKSGLRSYGGLRSKLDETNKVHMLKRDQKSLVDFLRYLTLAYRSKGGFSPIERQSYDNVMEMVKYWETYFINHV